MKEFFEWNWQPVEQGIRIFISKSIAMLIDKSDSVVATNFENPRTDVID
jgi:hypothetical protein